MSKFGKDINVPSRKGVFIPDITVEMLRNVTLEGVEDLLASGEMEDISLPSVEVIPVEWIERKIARLKEMDNAFASLTASQIAALLNDWRTEQNE